MERFLVTVALDNEMRTQLTCYTCVLVVLLRLRAAPGL